jgi:exodeoxyribonuclease-5
VIGVLVPRRDEAPLDQIERPLAGLVVLADDQQLLAVRSVDPILGFVNDKFAKPLSSEVGQPGFTALAVTRTAEEGALAVAALDIAVDGGKPGADKLRDAEADRVAELCTRLLGNLQVREREKKRSCRFGDIALLAPVGTDLWRFEEAARRAVAASPEVSDKR